MPRLSIEDLARIRDESRPVVALRTGTARAKVTVHMGTCGMAAGARNVVKTMLAEIERRKIPDVIIKVEGCAGACDREPLAVVELSGKGSVRYPRLDPAKTVRIVNDHIINGHVVTDLAE